MRFFDSTAYRVSLKAVSDDIASDLAFERSLKKLHENKLRRQAREEEWAKQAQPGLRADTQKEEATDHE